MGGGSEPRQQCMTCCQMHQLRAASAETACREAALLQLSTNSTVALPACTTVAPRRCSSAISCSSSFCIKPCTSCGGQQRVQTGGSV